MIELDTLCRAVGDSSGPLHIRGGSSRRFPLPQIRDAQAVDMAGYQGIIDYYPEELVVRVRAGTRLKELLALLDEQGQMLASEPPVHGESSTVGGMVAAGLSGSRRPYGAAIKDLMLGVGLILNDGTYAEFGGQVMKNVAGYDVSRLVCGSFGSLGPIADVSLKVVPKPECEMTTLLEVDGESAQVLTRDLRRQGAGLSASCYLQGKLLLRYSGSEGRVSGAIQEIGGDVVADEPWGKLDSQDLAAFTGAEVWRLSTDPAEPLAADVAVADWGFGQRWLVDPSYDPRQGYEGAGYWTRVRGSKGKDIPVFQPLPELQGNLVARLKQAFDPDGRFNPGWG